MSPVAKAVEEYLALRRSLGFELRRSAGILRSFARYLEHRPLVQALRPPTV